jgi:hypothetical protein
MGKNNRNKKAGGVNALVGGAKVNIGKSEISAEAISELQPSYSDFQPYFPLLNRFRENISSTEVGLAATSKFPENTDEVYVKAVHLLNPDDWIQGDYSFTRNVSMPGLATRWENVVEKLQCEENQAYVDTLTVSLLSQLREQGFSPHFVKFYGALVAKAEKYCYNISEDFQSYKATKWFWTNMKGDNFKLRIYSSEKDRFLTDDEMTPFLLKPEEIELLKEEPDENDNEQQQQDQQDQQDQQEEEILADLEVSPIGDSDSIHSVELEVEDNTSVRSILRVSPSNQTTGGSDDDDEILDSDFYTEFKNMPVMLIFMEKKEGAMDDLLGNEEYTEEMWTAWMLQIIFALTQAHAFIELYHNDLHGNNILYSTTTEEFLYYRSKDGQVWKVPTFGKIFYLIDFGRAILRVQGQQVISDDFFEGNDAEGQYNFGAIRNPKEPAVIPNPSFDLVRLAVSIFEALFEEKPEEKKGPMVSVLSREGGSVIKETVSPLYNLLWMWMVDIKGRSVLHDPEGNERFPGFDLYKHIATSCKGAVPKDQIRKPIFEQFKCSEKTPENTTVYPLFV